MWWRAGDATGVDGAVGEAELEGAASRVEVAGSRAEEAAEPVAEDGPRPVDAVVAEAGEEEPGGLRGPARVEPQPEGDPRGDGLHGPSLWHAGGAA
jgi:hypothetical protein